MNLQRNAATVGSFLVLVLGTIIAGMAAGLLAGASQSSMFGIIMKVLMTAAIQVSTLNFFMRWGYGGSIIRWLGVSFGAYVVTPASWSANTLFARSLGAPGSLAWIVDAFLWLGLTWLVARRVLPEATRDDSIDRLR